MNKYNLIVGILLLIYGLLMLFGVIAGSVIYAVIALILGLWGLLTGIKKGEKKTIPPTTPQ